MGENLEMFTDAKNGDITSKRRSRLNIIAEILYAAINGAVKTRIMYRVNVNFVQFNDHVKCLLEAKLIRTIRRRRRTVYETTEKGRLLLHIFNEAEEMLKAASSKKGDKPLIVEKGPMVYLVKK